MEREGKESTKSFSFSKNYPNLIAEHMEKYHVFYMNVTHSLGLIIKSSKLKDFTCRSHPTIEINTQRTSKPMKHEYQHEMTKDMATCHFKIKLGYGKVGIWQLIYCLLFIFTYFIYFKHILYLALILS